MVPDPILHQDDPVNSQPKTMFEKVWDDHVVVPETADTPAVLFIDLHLTHEVTTPQAYDGLRAAGRRVRRPVRLSWRGHPTAPEKCARLNCHA